MGEKDFGLIENEYAFFMAHATEAEQDAAAYARELAGFAPRPDESLRLLDFGCGDGTFTERLLTTLAWPPPALRLALVEPVRRQLAEAALRLAAFSTARVEAWEGLPSSSAGFDLIVSNHVLYYVGDLDVTLRQLVSHLAPGARMLLALAGWDNPLLDFWRIGFRSLGQSVPYFTADDLATALTRQGLAARRMKVDYRLTFADTRDNRLLLLRFLLGEHLPQMDPQPLLTAFDRFARQGQIDVRTHSWHFAVDARTPRP